jgi:peroxiredoxin Q/BCP
MKMTKILTAILAVTLLGLTACSSNKNSSEKGGETLEVESMAPDFTLKDQDGMEHSLSDFRGKNVLVYFYPKDDTPGCSKEACTIRDTYSEFQNMNVQVIGISPDSAESHKKFAEKNSLPFLLLSDADQSVAKLYKADGKMVARISYLIDAEGKIEKAYPDVDPSSHAQEVLADLQNSSDSEATAMESEEVDKAETANHH